MLKLIVDYRENYCIELIHNIVSDINVNVENLPLGDFCYYKDGRMVCLIERKTINDYVSSITDKRNKEQTFRINKLKDENNEIIVIYLIEGEIPSKDKKFYGSVTGESVYSSICNKIVKHRFFIWNSKNIDDSIRFIIKLYDKFNSNELEIDNEYARTISLNKKNMLTPNIWFKLVLAQIPSVSIDIANEIIKYYPSMLSLYLIYSKCDEKKGKLLLSNIMCGKKRLGNVLSEKIYSYIMDTHNVIGESVPLKPPVFKLSLNLFNKK